MANHLINSSETELGHDGPQLVGHVVKEIDHMLRSASKLIPQFGILGSNTNRACVNCVETNVSG